MQALVVVLALAGGAAARPTYPARLPNGANVPGVAALGHTDPAGGGPNNAFGLAFADAGHEWTAALCAQDSDGDGQTNGQELGDPCCEWSTDAAAPRFSTGVSHPGDADDTADPELWANITCGSASASTSASTSTSGGDGDASAAGSDADSTTSDADATPTPTPTPTSGSEGTAGVAAAAVAVALVATAAAM